MFLWGAELGLEGCSSVPPWTTSGRELAEGRDGSGWLARLPCPAQHPGQHFTDSHPQAEGATQLHSRPGTRLSLQYPFPLCSVFLARISMFCSLLSSRCLEPCLAGGRSSMGWGEMDEMGNLSKMLLGFSGGHWCHRLHRFALQSQVLIEAQDLFPTKPLGRHPLTPYNIPIKLPLREGS